MSGQGQSPATRRPSPGEDKVVRVEEVVAGGGGTSLSAGVSVLGACDHLRARDPTEHPLHFPRCGAGSQWSQWSRVCAGSQWSPCPAPRTQHLPTSCHHTTHADTTGDYNAHFVQYSGKINHKYSIIVVKLREREGKGSTQEVDCLLSIVDCRLSIVDYRYRFP